MRLNRRRLTSLQAKLDALHPPPAKCEYCGDIDPVTKSGPFFGGLVIKLANGFHWCWCKACGNSFNAHLREDERGWPVVTDVCPASGGPV